MNNRFLVRLLGSMLFLILTALWISSCNKESSPTNTVDESNTGNGNITGVVKDASVSGNPVLSGATVKVVGDTSSVTSDADGKFTLTIANGVNKTLSVTKDGYSLNEVVVNLSAGVKKNISVNLLQVGKTQNVSVSSGGTVSDTKSNAVLKLPSNFVNSSGNVSVTVTGLDPTTEQIRALPGGLDAIDANGNKKYLQPVSFAEYTVKDANGNVLQFNSSASSGANIELPIPVSLRGKPGYKNGDPIECYVYDAADGKWKTPVPGIVGPSSIDGNPAIKATIFHLSWYGGAPALNQRACIQGYVKNIDGTPAVGADVEAFAGGSTKTDATGFFEVDAAPSSNVRVVATVLSGTKVSTAEVVVYTGDPTDSCYKSPDLTLGVPQQGSFEVDATLYKSGSDTTYSDFAIATIKLKPPSGTATSYDGADVKIGYGSNFFSLQSVGQGSGEYWIYTGLPGTSTFVLTPGEQYEIKIDFDKNGTVDANGLVRMVGVSTITNPTDKSTVGKSFTASWNDNGSSKPGYSANYWLTVTGDSAYRYFLTTTTSKVIGDGSVDSTFYGSALKNDPLPSGNYMMNVWSFNGPVGFLTVGTQLPNINGQNVKGYFYSYFFGKQISFTSTGNALASINSNSKNDQLWKVPIALKNFYKSIPASVKKRTGVSLMKK